MEKTAFENAFAAADLPGAAALIVDREGHRLEAALGLADVETGAAFTLDTLCQIASMTKAVTALAAMQLVESGRMALDDPIAALLPELGAAQVLEGFDEAERPLLRAPVRPITLRHLLTHTAGMGYFFINPEVMRYFRAVGMPANGSIDSIRLPLLADPGEGWSYSVASEWVGLAIEAVTGRRLRDHLRDAIFAPLGMERTGFHDHFPTGAARIHARRDGGGFTPLQSFVGGSEFDMGGGGLLSTARDYARFVRAMLRGGELDGARVLGEQAMAEFTRDQTPGLKAGELRSILPNFSRDYDPLPGQDGGWSLGFMTNRHPGPDGRSAASQAWAGIFNTYFWIDPAAGLGGLLLCQLSPFADPGALGLFSALERGAYAQGRGTVSAP